MDGSKIKVLVLDDDPFMLKLLGLMLGRLGFAQIERRSTGQAALQCVDDPSSAPDLILVDLNMPGMDGVEFVRHLAERAFAGSLILVSAEVEATLQAAESLAQAHGIRVLGRLHKTLTLDNLAALLGSTTLTKAQPAPELHGPLQADELRAAIASGQLENLYQPIVDLSTGQVTGAEALVRWRHPQRGLVLPDQFIGVAEAHGLIDALTAGVIDRAMTHAKAWRAAGVTLRVSVNVSRDNLASLDFPDRVQTQTEAMGIPPQDVALEITESRVMTDLPAPLEVLTRLRQGHFRLSIDNFGTGHSTRTQLRNFPFDELKVDRTFVCDAFKDDTLRAVYDASLQLANQFGMQTVAEGVQSKADWDFVRDTGCRMAQGYFIARPMPAAALPAWVGRWRTRVREESLAAA